jgi:hypothetical protein
MPIASKGRVEMRANIGFSDRSDSLLVVYQGPFSLGEGRGVIDGMLQACAEHGRVSVLFDCRGMTGRFTVMDRFQVVIYGLKIRGAIRRLAIVGRREDILPDRFAETVAFNRGIDMKVFADVAEAERWLKA